jgi:hypothetical protein
MRLLKPLLSMAATTILLTGCISIRGEPVAICPQIQKYSVAEQDKLLEEYRRLPANSIIKRTLGDYLNLRDQVRACRGASNV